MPEHFDARTTISRDMFYWISADQNLTESKKKIKTSLLTIKCLKKGCQPIICFYLALTVEKGNKLSLEIISVKIIYSKQCSR